MYFSIVSIKPECSGSIPCLHECELQFPNGRRVAFLDSDTLKHRLPAHLNHFAEHLNRKRPFNSQKIKEITVGECEPYADHCCHQCKLTFNDETTDSFYLLSQEIASIFVVRAKHLVANWTQSHFQSSSCTLL